MSEYKLMKWSELKATLPPDSIARIDARFRETMSRLRLSDIREAVGHTQVELAAQLKLGQASVSKIESAADMYLSTLRRYIEAQGGERGEVAQALSVHAPQKPNTRTVGGSARVRNR
ncbi:MAG: hypothetical protein RLZZ116_1901 [Planctomycetota bacterium]|jgi:ribosome-binding protein aMBF1 (putative translation factor)